MIPAASDAALLSIADFYILAPRSDLLFRHLIAGGNAREVAAVEVRPQWARTPIDVAAAIRGGRHERFNAIFLHHWAHGLAFAYLDVGASVGLTSVSRAVFFKRCGRPVPIHAFEPSSVYPLLAETVRINGVEDIMTAHDLAVSDRSGPIDFHILAGKSTGSSLLPEAAELYSSERTTRTMQGVSLDDFVAQIGLTQHLICKIDVEGADLKVVDGLAETIRSRFVTMQIEFLPALIDAYADPAERLRALTGDFILLAVGDRGCRWIGPDPDGIAAFVEGLRRSGTLSADIMLLPRKLPDVADLAEHLVFEAP